MPDEKRCTFKLPGRCSVCDEPVFEVVQVWNDGPMQGRARKFGPPLEGAKRATVVLTNGTRSDFTLCGTCHLTPETSGLVAAS